LATISDVTGNLSKAAIHQANGRAHYVRPAAKPQEEEASDQPALPPIVVHSPASLVLTQPWPLQAFWPLQELVAVLQALWPLQLLAPTHFTPSAAKDAVGATIVPAANIAAAAAARTTPEVFCITPEALSKTNR
jgi:hypothetical protein